MEEDIRYIDCEAVIQIIEDFLKKEKTEILGISVGEEHQLRMAIQNLIARYKELKESLKFQKKLTKIAQIITDESLKEALEEIEKDYIPKSKVKEKIEELKKDKENEKEDEWLHCSSVNNLKISVLQELLED